jgi:hypothetical protein
LRFFVWGAASRKASTIAATWVSETGCFACAKDGKNPKLIIPLNMNAIGFLFMILKLLKMSRFRNVN